jgi:Nuclease subunit of the excinuclease complex
VRLKDNKTFPYLKINVEEDWPGVYITRRLQKDGARYFGPFASAGSVRKTLRLIRKIFPFRSCSKPINGKDKRPCLEYYIHRCLGPCIGAISRQEYQEVINQVILFLEGKQEIVLHELTRKMRTSAQQLQFERAALLRDQIQAIEKVIEGQKFAMTLRGEQDSIALAQTEGQAYVEIFFVRNNKLIGRDHFIMEGVHDEKPDQIMTSFVKQYYASASYIPPLILLQYPVEQISMLSSWLKQQRGKKRKTPSAATRSQKAVSEYGSRECNQGFSVSQNQAVGFRNHNF